jgi:tetratricopeptide (TPR) repeat protein
LGGIAFRKPFTAERNALRERDRKKRAEALAEAQKGFEALAGLLAGAVNARRYVEYKVAQVAVQRAEDDPTLVDAAIKALSDYKTANPAGWEIVPALRTLAKLQEDSGKPLDAQKSYEELSRIPDAPLALRQEAEILVGRLLLRGEKFGEAESWLRKLEVKLPKNDPQRGFIQAYLAASQLGQNNLKGVEEQLKEAIRGSEDGRLRGLAYNLLGDYYQQRNQLEEAFWQYLRVDALYTDDPEEQAKALYQLRILFDKARRDPIRARECAQRLLKDDRLAGTAYQRKAAREEKK